MKNGKNSKQRILQFFRRIVGKEEPLGNNKKDNEEHLKLKKMLAQIDYPSTDAEICDFHERCKRFERYEDKSFDFWAMENNYILYPKYQNVPLKKNQGKEQKER